MILPQKNILAAGVLAALLLATALGLWLRDTQAGSIDLAQYWSAARLFVSGRNPYDPQLLGEIQRSEFPGRETILMWNPPHILALTFPLGFMSFTWAKAIWSILTFGSFAYAIISALKLVRQQSGVKFDRATGACLLLFALSFYPLYSCAWYGQASFMPLVGVTLFLANTSRQGAIRTWPAALGLFLTTIKPHEFYLLYLFLVFEWLRRREAALIVRTAAILGVSLAAIAVYSPQVFSWYIAAWSAPPLYFRTPTLGAWLQDFTQIHSLAIRALPSMIFAGAYILLRLKFSAIKDELQHLLVLIPFSLVSAPYGWIFDHVVLLPTAFWIVLHANSQRRWWPAVLLVALNISIMPMPGKVVPFQIYELYYPLGFGILALMCTYWRKQALPASKPQQPL